MLFLIVILSIISSAWSFSPRSRERNWGRKYLIPLCYREAYANSRGRQQLETQLAGVLSMLPSDATVLMYTSDYVGAIQQANIPFRRVISESTFITWDAALSAPFATADYVVAIDNDPVAKAVAINPRGLTKMIVIHGLDQPNVAIYRSSRGQ